MLISLFFQEPIMFVAWAVAMILSVTLHEFSHALAAYAQGDPTAKYAGRLSLNPLKHLDFLGTLMLLLVGFGWGKPVPFNPYNLKNQKWGPAIVALAGPVANLILILVFGFALNILSLTHILNSSNMLYVLFEMIVILNAIWFVFNLIPIPPLDGSKILFAILPSRYDSFKIFLTERGPFILLALLILDRILPISIFNFLFSFVLALISKIFNLNLL